MELHHFSAKTSIFVVQIVFRKYTSRGRQYSRRGKTVSEPHYSMRSVVRMTGVPAATLRSWERRYGFPTPDRTATARRLYSAADVQAIQWVKAQTTQGFAISEAVRQIAGSERTSEQDIRGGPSKAAHTVPLVALAGPVAALVAAWVAYDEPRAEAVLSDAFARHSADVVVLAVIMPALLEIGERWAGDELLVAAEHFASNIVRRRLLSLLAQLPPLQAAPTAVLACVPGEDHELGLLALGLFLRWLGVAVVYLGADVPVDSLIRCVRETGAAVICLSATAPESAPVLAAMVAGLGVAALHSSIVVGGPATADVVLPPAVQVLSHDLRQAAAQIALTTHQVI